MFAVVSALRCYLLSWLRPKHELTLENLAFRHQIAVLNRQAYKSRLQREERLFWVVLKRWRPKWRAALIIFQLESVIGWQRDGCWMFWRAILISGRYSEVVNAEKSPGSTKALDFGFYGDHSR